MSSGSELRRVLKHPNLRVKRFPYERPSKLKMFLLNIGLAELNETSVLNLVLFFCFSGKISSSI